MTREDSSNNSRIKKWGIISAIIVAFIFLASILTINFVIEPYAEERITTAFSKVSSGDAELTMSELDIGIFPLSMTLQNIGLERGVNASERLKDHPVLQSTIGNLTVSGFSLFSYLSDGEINVGDVVIDEANLHLSPGLTERYQSPSDSGSEGSGRTGSISVDRIRVSLTSVEIYSEDLSEVDTRLSGADIELSGLLMQGDGASSTPGLDALALEIDSVSHTTNQGFYSARSANILFDSNEGAFSAEGFELVPLLSPKELPRVLGHEMDHMDIESGMIKLSGLKSDMLFTEGKIEAAHLSVSKPMVKISRDKSPPDKIKEPRPLMNTAFAQLPTPISIDSLTIDQGYISYREWQESQDSSGTVFFDSIDLKVMNLQNIDREERITAEARTSFMNLADLSVLFNFSLLEDGSQTVSGRMEGLDLEALNPVLVPLAFVRIDRGVIHSVDFDFELNNSSSSGEFITLYENFSMRLLSKDGLHSSTGKRIVSFLANNIQIHSSNTEPDPRIGEISYEKEVGQSTVNYWWKSIRSGMKDLVQRI